MTDSDINLNKETCCCFTGHRPNKLKSSEADIRAALRCEIDKAIADGYDTFITGMAPGVDTWAAFEVISIKENNPDIKLVCAIPFENVEKSRSDTEKAEFNAIVQKSDSVEYICRGRSKWCFIVRDKWMINHSGRVIAVFNGTSGGTEYTLNYAREKKCEACIIADGEDE